MRREEHRHGKTEQGDAAGGQHGVLQRLLHAIEALCAVVVADDGLRTLVDAHHRHEDHHEHGVDDTPGGNGQFAAVDAKLVVDDDVEHGIGDLQGEGGGTDGQQRGRKSTTSVAGCRRGGATGCCRRENRPAPRRPRRPGTAPSPAPPPSCPSGKRRGTTAPAPTLSTTLMSMVSMAILGLPSPRIMLLSPKETI